jgi:hypothetical protein
MKVMLTRINTKVRPTQKYTEKRLAVKRKTRVHFFFLVFGPRAYKRL